MPISRGARMPDREELHELHVDERARPRGDRARSRRRPMIARCAVAAIEPCQSAGRDDGGLGRKHHPAFRCRHAGGIQVISRCHLPHKITVGSLASLRCSPEIII